MVQINKISRKVANVVMNGKLIGTLTYNASHKMFILSIVNEDEAQFSSLDAIKVYVESNFAEYSFNDSNIKDEWIVEKKDWETNRCKVIAKVLMSHSTQHLSYYDLEDIWDLGNYGCSYPKRMFISDNSEAYKGMACYAKDEARFVYLPIAKDSVVNNDIFIRPHYDTENGYFLKPKGNKGGDEWTYGTRLEFLKLRFSDFH